MFTNTAYRQFAFTCIKNSYYSNTCCFQFLFDWVTVPAQVRPGPQMHSKILGIVEAKLYSFVLSSSDVVLETEALVSRCLKDNT